MRKVTTYREPKRTNSINKYNINYNASANTQPNIFNNASTNYFCHYKNAMYMGGIKSFKKDGKGILLHDCGVSVLSNYLNDIMHGHNVFFADHCLLSVDFFKGKIIQAVYRTDGFLIHLYYNSESQLQGKCKLLSYINKTITYAVFKKGILIEKQDQTDFSIVNKVFDLGEIQVLIGIVHANVVKYDFQKSNNIQGHKYGNKLVIGFQKGGFINGLAFTIIFRGSHGGYNPQTHRNEDEFELRVMQRGYMNNSQLHGFGEKWFKNQNYYVGEFKNGIFEGNGLLRNTMKKNWVSGYFQKGNLIDLIDYNNENGDKKFDKVIEALHERKSNWINNEIVLVSMDIFDKQIQKILNQKPNYINKSIQQRKLQVLKRIQDNFLCQPTGSLFNITDKWKKTSNKTQQSVKHFVNSFIPHKHNSKNEQIKHNENGQEIRLDLEESLYKLSSYARSPNSIRKIKIFDKSLTPNRNYKLSQSKRTNNQTPSKKKIFDLSSTAAKSKLILVQNNSESKGSLQGSNQKQIKKPIELQSQKMDNNSISVGHMSNNSEINHDLSKIQFNHKNTLNFTQPHGKSTIFKSIKAKQEQISPKFTYTPIDNPKESKSFGLDETL